MYNNLHILLKTNVVRLHSMENQCAYHRMFLIADCATEAERDKCRPLCCKDQSKSSRIPLVNLEKMYINNV